jgi:hypothetical protein
MLSSGCAPSKVVPLEDEVDFPVAVEEFVMTASTTGPVLFYK